MLDKCDARMPEREVGGFTTQEVYTPDEVRKILGVSTSTVYGFLRANVIPYMLVNGMCKIPKESFDQWWESIQHATGSL